MTRLELLTQWAYRLEKTPPPDMDATTQARALGYLNQRQRRLLTLDGLAHLRDATVTFSSVADQVSYVLPNIAKVARIFDPTNQRVLYEMSQQDYRLVDPVPLSGTPEAVIWTGRQQTAKQPSDASSLFVKSSSASDTTQTAYVVGVITGGYQASASVTLTGTTAVNVSSTTSTWERVDKFFLSAAGAGFVTLHEDSGSGTELARIPIAQTYSQYFGFKLWPTPSGVISYSVDLTRAITDLAQDTDVPVLPEDFHDILMLGAVADEYQRLKDERYSIATSEYMARVGELQYWLFETPIGKPRTLVRRWQRPSQLGSWYPAGT